MKKDGQNGQSTPMTSRERFLATMGVEDWRRFLEVMYLLVDRPGLVREMMRIQGEFAASLAEVVLKEVDIDAAITPIRHDSVVIQNELQSLFDWCLPN